MKVAVNFSGQFRFYDKPVQSIIQNLLDPYDCDVFCYFSNNISNNYDDVSDQEIIEKTNKKLGSKLKKLQISGKEHNPTGDGSFASDFLKTIELYGNVHPRNRKMELCDNLRKQYEKDNNFKYDIVVNLRPDFILQKPFKFKENIEDKTVYAIGKEFSNKEKGYEKIPRVFDGFWYANSQTFSKAVTNMIGWFPSMNGIKEDPKEIFEKLRLKYFIFTPEDCLLYNWIVKDKLKVELFDLPIVYRHPDGRIVSYENFQPIHDNIETNLPRGFVLPEKYCIDDLTHLCR